MIRPQRRKIILASAVFLTVFLFVSAGAIYYVIGTPEYSLYKLREAIVNNSDAEVEKYLDIESVAENFNETPSQSKEWI